MIDAPVTDREKSRQNLLGRFGSFCLGAAGMTGRGRPSGGPKSGEWLKRYLRPHGYRVHHVELRGDYLHLLGVLCLIREGLAMAYMPALGNALPEPIKDWEVIQLTLEETLALGTVGMHLDEKTHMIDRRHRRLVRELERRNIDCVEMPVDYLACWGGAVRRPGTLSRGWRHSDPWQGCHRRPVLPDERRGGPGLVEAYLEPYDKIHALPMQGDILHGLGVLCLVREGLPPPSGTGRSSS